MPVQQAPLRVADLPALAGRHVLLSCSCPRLCWRGFCGRACHQLVWAAGRRCLRRGGRVSCRCLLAEDAGGDAGHLLRGPLLACAATLRLGILARHSTHADRRSSVCRAQPHSRCSQMPSRAGRPCSAAPGSALSLAAAPTGGPSPAAGMVASSWRSVAAGSRLAAPTGCSAASGGSCSRWARSTSGTAIMLDAWGICTLPLSVSDCGAGPRGEWATFGHVRPPTAQVSHDEHAVPLPCGRACAG